MSDSGVFESLELQEIVTAGKQEGVYHNNIFVTLKLGSPYLKDPSHTSVHEVMAVPKSAAAAVDGVLQVVSVFAFV